MSTQPIIIEFGSYRWPRHLAIHEAGHAIAAWFFGIQEVEIALSGNNRVAKTYLRGDVDECGAVAVWQHGNYPRNVAGGLHGYNELLLQARESDNPEQAEIHNFLMLDIERRVYDLSRINDRLQAIN
ncbi:TPA: hypothetical protein L1V98_002382 [Escherichia coli]|nr:hypothetical protein [Escherichia coli]HBN1174141.1 hypothetical protein [Escherichia coli]HBN1303600.1 hypothetical protein [Escherichia coli]HBN1320084.1 hypothetical protein [Escherichia coli]